ncbi:hypothetical protein DFQ09_11157 [Winogradskyella pacifica]|uniref:Uncharacterized protein n=1 Tax=Winogradskyella pacifica TaxID=664642 RepID=A0A3D9LMW5_9FLAO|nr:hypothetical protein [Winogradskyella pacifica]REE07727.1 hypothetical protein DFQ09_11157 [Winogradskyella pacifica]
MTRRIYRIVIVIAVVLWICIFIVKDSYSNSFLIIASSLTFLAFSFGIHGLIAYSIHPPSTNGKLITFPLLMWVLWAVMFLVFVFLIIPVYCPDFLMDM